MLKCLIIPVTPFQQNCSLVWCEKTKRAAAVDPGGDLHLIRQAIADQGVTLEKVLLTHGHLDHATAAGTLASEFGVKIEGPHPDDLYLIEELPEAGKKCGFKPEKPFVPDRWLDDGEHVTVGDVQFDVVHCPGHTPGHVVFVQPEMKIAFVGDVLFRGSVGRSDFPRGNGEQLVHSIRAKLFPRGDDITFVPGHGQTSTFGWERKTNPYVCDMLFEDD
jgi:glyoxylase-like metal-dependent hydrolase (beta-lactamase superfamily II)